MEELLGSIPCVMLSSEHLFAGVEVDRVKVHVVGSPGEPETRDRVEKLSGKSCAIVCAVEPPANRKHVFITLLVYARSRLE